MDGKVIETAANSKFDIYARLNAWRTQAHSNAANISREEDLYAHVGNPLSISIGMFGNEPTQWQGGCPRIGPMAR